MRKLLLVLLALFSVFAAQAQEKSVFKRTVIVKSELPDMKKYIMLVQGYMRLYTQNAANHSQEHDVNSIILDIEKYIDSMPKNRNYGDQLLMKYFNPLRHFFLTTTNKTAVATSFLYNEKPYQFCAYNDTGTALYLYAIKDGSNYNLAKTTEKRVIKSALENCLLPSLKALDEFKGSSISYIGVSVYYGCKDSREGAVAGAIIPYCLTLVASAADLEQYASGLITAKGLLNNSDVYLSDEDGRTELNKLHLTLE